MQKSLFENNDFGEPDVDMARRYWCEECGRRTLFRRDVDGMPLCIEHAEESQEIES